MILPDILAEDLDLVLCGTAPSRASKEAAAYYANPGNRFWATLAETGLTPVRLAPRDYARVLDFGLGLTDVNKSEWGSDAELSRHAFDAPGLWAKLARWRPAALAFTSKQAARCALGRPAGYGRQAEPVSGIPIFVLPSPSGRARAFWDLAPWHEVAAFVAARRAARVGARAR